MKNFLFILLFIFSIVFIEMINGVQVFEVFKMIQYKEMETQTYFGSQRANLNLMATSTMGTSLSRLALLIRLEEMSAEKLKEMGKRRLEGLVIIIPSTFKDSSRVDKWIDFESQLILKRLPIPVFFCYENEEINNLQKTLQYHSDFQFIVSGPTETPSIPSYSFANIQV